jgi:hypothetical protein
MHGWWAHLVTSVSAWRFQGTLSSSARSQQATPLAAQEEDRSDIEDADHHGERGYHKYA